MNTDGTPRSTGAAPDGEEYYVMALYFAAHRWGNGKGIYNYQAEADKILRGMRHHPVLSGTGPFRIHPEDPPFVPPDHPWPSPNETTREGAQGSAEARRRASRAPKPQCFRFPRGPSDRDHRADGGRGAQHDQVCAQLPERRDGCVSYHLPAFYELWARWGPVEDRAFWAKAAEVSRGFFRR